jgi:hypothetical protein
LFPPPTEFTFNTTEMVFTKNTHIMLQLLKEEFFSDDVPRSYSEIKEIEGERKRLSEASKSYSGLQVLTTFTGTIIPHIICSPQSWFILMLYCVIRSLMNYDIIFQGPDMPQINTAVVSIMGGFMSFFIVFFLSQTYSRFMQNLELTTRVRGRAFHMLIIARSTLPKEETYRLFRYLNVIHILAYIGLSEIYTEKNILIPLNEKYYLLTEPEFQRLRSIGLKGGSAHREVIVWCIDMIFDVFHQGQARIDHAREKKDSYSRYSEATSTMDENSLRILIDELFTIRSMWSQIYALCEQSFPFSYLHLTFLVSTMYLMIITYTVASFIPVSQVSSFPDLLGGALVLVNVFFVVGIREIARQMIDPFGLDLTDISVVENMEYVISNTRSMLAAQRFQSPGLAWEEEVNAKRPPMKKAFDEQPLKYALNQYYLEDFVRVAEPSGIKNPNPQKEFSEEKTDAESPESGSRPTEKSNEESARYGTKADANSGIRPPEKFEIQTEGLPTGSGRYKVTQIAPTGPVSINRSEVDVKMIPKPPE